jgi:uncharacterized membrane protein
MGAADTTDRLRAYRLKRVAVIAGIALIVLILVAVGIYVGAFVILSPHDGVTTQTQCRRHSIMV